MGLTSYLSYLYPIPGLRLPVIRWTTGLSLLTIQRPLILTSLISSQLVRVPQRMTRRWEIIPVRHGGCKRGKGPKVAKFLDKWTGEFCPRCLPWMKIDFTFPFLFSFILTIHLPIHYIHCWFILSFHHSYYRWNNIRTNMNDE